MEKEMTFRVERDVNDLSKYTVKFITSKREKFFCFCKNKAVWLILVLIGLAAGFCCEFFLLKLMEKNVDKILLLVILLSVFVISCIVILKILISCQKYSKKVELIEKSLDEIKSLNNLQLSECLKSIFEDYFSMLSDL